MSIGNLKTEGDLKRWLHDQLRTPGLVQLNQVRGVLPTEDFTDVSSFSNSWVNFDSTSLAGYMRDRQGLVHLRGWIKDGTAGASAFTLPTGYRPEQNSIIPIGYVTGGLSTDANYVSVNTDGTVVPATAATNILVSLDGVYFKAAV